ncbi:hypothetical protein Asi03nite_62670 [Actinoplanes siamensis]|uniref:Uncharacterized protein n=1 Tax=Actinoplanes siamensis TaxID=1223317 RepID=A0A919NDI0_9ACTN|nr:hypothetical protein Asi03nite_62670 [Actinoplanes siamensis]
MVAGAVTLRWVSSTQATGADTPPILAPICSRRNADALAPTVPPLTVTGMTVPPAARAAMWSVNSALSWIGSAWAETPAANAPPSLATPASSRAAAAAAPAAARDFFEYAMSAPPVSRCRCS